LAVHAAGNRQNNAAIYCPSPTPNHPEKVDLRNSGKGWLRRLNCSLSPTVTGGRLTSQSGSLTPILRYVP